MRVGLTGGIGSGKSEVARILDRLGAFIIDTDQLAREVVAPGGDALREIVRAWPQVVRGEVLDRGALAEVVFHDPKARERLNAIVHPHIRRLALEREHGAKPGQIIVHVVPLLFETGYGALCDVSVLVVAPDEQRIARVMQRDGANEEQIRARIAAQMSPEQARARAGFVIENDGDLRHLEERTKVVYDELVDMAAKRCT